MGTTDSRDVQAKIQLRRNAFSADSSEIKFKHNETLKELIERSLLETGYPSDSKLEEYFQVVKDGVIVDKELYDFLKVEEGATYLIAPELKRGSGAQIFKQIAILAIAVTASYFLGPQAGLGIWGAVGAAAITVAGTLALNALIPPPSMSMDSGGLGNIEEQSQMYAISGQSNSLQKYGTVPKVYGTHRLFPKLAATPYVTTELDTATEEWVQYYHAIYDFGFGPNLVTDLRIGGTPLNEFKHVSWNFVDPHVSNDIDLGQPWCRPDIMAYDAGGGLTTLWYKKWAVETEFTSNRQAWTSSITEPILGVGFIINVMEMVGSPFDYFPTHPTTPNTLWIDTLNKVTYYTDAVATEWKFGFHYNEIIPFEATPTSFVGDIAMRDRFEIYKGIVEINEVNSVLDVNASDLPSPPPEAYTTIAAIKPKLWGQGLASFLECNLVFPQGLVAHNTSGSAGDRSVQLKVDIGRKVGTELDGRPVYTWEAPAFVTTSGVTSTSTTIDTLSLAPPNRIPEAYSPLVQRLMREADYQHFYIYTTTLQPISGQLYIPVIGTVNLEMGDSVTFKTLNGTTATQVYTVTSAPIPYVGDPAITLVPISGGGSHVAWYTEYGFYWYMGPPQEWYPVPTLSGTTRWKRDYGPYWPVHQSGAISTTNAWLGANLYSIGSPKSSRLVTFTGAKLNTQYASLRIDVPMSYENEKELAVRLTRFQSTSVNTYQILDKLQWTNMVLKYEGTWLAEYRPPITSPKKHTFLELRLRATGQISGQIDNLSGIVHAAVPYYDGASETWKFGITNNPAWIFADLITGQINRKAVSLDRLHAPSLLEWANFCDEIIESPTLYPYTKRFTSNFILDYKVTLQSILNAVGGAGQATLNIVDGKYGVLIDKKKTTPVQVFTPRNSSNVSVVRSYPDRPHALKMRYVDPATWDVAEVIVFEEGYNISNAEDFEEITAFSCTNAAQAWRLGRYMLAQTKYRLDNISIEVDYENLVCTRGDFVQIAQDVLCAGGVPARVLEINTSTVGTTITRTIVLDDNVDFSSDDYGIVIRNTANIVTLPTTLLTPDTVQIQTEVGSDITINEGDLVVVGERGREVMDCIVKSISPMDDFKAQLTLVEKADEIHDYAENMAAMIPYTPDMNEATEIELTPVKITGLVGGDTVWGVEDMQYVYFIQDVSWNMPLIENWEHFEVYRKLNGEWELTEIVHTNSCSFRATPEEVVNGYELKVLAVSPLGKKLPLEDAAEVDGEIDINDAAPANVASLDLDMDEVSATLKWPAVPAIDIIGYVIRFTTELENPTWAAASHYAEVGNITEFPVARQTGTYLIKAKALNLILSVDSAMAISDIPDGDIVVGDSFEISNYPWDSSEGVYTSVDILDEGLPEVRTTLTGTWVGSTWSVDAVEGSIVLEDGSINLDLPRPSLAPYEVELESLLDVREIPFSAASNMASWANLSDLLTLVHDTPPHVDCRVVSQVSTDGGVTWTTFTKDKFELGTFQLRHLLTTNDVEYAPVLLEGKVKVNYLTYKKQYNGVILPASAVSFTHDDPFYGPVSPTVKVTIDSASEGDYYLITNATTAGFDIEIFDADDNPVSRAVDIVAIGY